MKDCTVSMFGKDGVRREHPVLRASSLMAVAYRVLEQCSRLWWYEPGTVIEVRAGEETWRARPQRVWQWRAEQQGRRD